MNRLILTLLIGASTLIAGCGFWLDEPECGKPIDRRVQTGTYRVVPGGYCQPVAEFPASEDREATVEVDRENQRLTITYQRDGSTVVETYKITSSTVF